ncbi:MULTISPECIES: peptide-methionine (S)-S-oxide reductase MsrA [unclassified Flavobacterium]|uniref:peptide-methionine (S)-S-oxide reductase MsrA n=1 Tax=unclassified Flavobacterium TaxID=196869 RepID=UPI000A3D783B|nr:MULTISPECIES: peptide-methionine (S)-S-oxide reductase MsrA [unclassified Flavobacterium]MEA9412555.1 peptide-methionine (S)-S-oxide reductase MsrA [Flavobacterium sp. PL02]OUL62888.1 peptide-methionine (S)-S-oxide reductase [Flavobacterium sp. AJR]
MKNLSIATFGGGCFWCIEAVIQRLKGIISIKSGYADGHIKNPAYREVCTGRTGHAEVIQVTFDPEIISYHDLIAIFMTSHDPTTLNQQGADRGTQYRSIILYHNEEQKVIAEQVFEAVKPLYADPIVTELKPFEVFYEAEEDHQNYYNNNQEAGYCRMVIDPKVQKLRKMYADKLA